MGHVPQPRSGLQAVAFCPRRTADSDELAWRSMRAGRGRHLGPRHMQFFIAVDQPLVPVEPLQFHAGRRQAKEAHAAIHRTQRRVHARIAIHPAEIAHVIVQFQLVSEQHLQHHVQGLIKQSALDRVVVVLRGMNFKACVLKVLPNPIFFYGQCPSVR